MASFFRKRIILSRNSPLTIPRRNGYLILVPEIGEDLPGKYPLLKEDKNPEFTNITIEKCVAVIGRQALEFEETVKTVEKQIENVDDISPEILFKNVLNPIEEIHTSLNITWGIAKTLYLGNQSLMPTQYYMSINERAKRALAFKYINTSIYDACKNVMNNNKNELNDEQKRILTKYILEGKLNGLELYDKKKKQLPALRIWLEEKLKKYSQKIEAAINHLTFTIRDPVIVKDFPEDLLKYMAVDPTQFLNGPWIVTLTPDILEPFMEHCPDRALRWKVWDANVTKASLLHDRSLQTSTTLEEIRQKRNQEGQILGYESFSHLSMETKMAGSVENIYHVFDTLLATARPAQQYEINELQAFASERGMEGALQPWDIAYWGRKQLRSVYMYKEEELNNYFPLPKVLCGLFELIETLFDVKIIEGKKVDFWHKDVQYFDVFDLKQSNTDPIGGFYFDPYARGNEKVKVPQNWGYAVEIQNRSKVCGLKPLVALIFSFQPPNGEKPALLSFKDLQMLFRQFGHALHYLLTKIEYADITGFACVEWDAMFISDYLFENWLYEPSFVQKISCHQVTEEPLPLDIITNIRNSKTHLSGYNLCKEMYLSQFDLELYSGKEFWNNIMLRLWKKYFVFPAYKRDSHICSFDAIFSGQWAAAYYSHLWSKMIAADLYGVFQGISNKNKESLEEVGRRYRESFLSFSGIYSTNENFRKFTGRDPNPKALLKDLGLDTKCSMLKGTDNPKFNKS
ncbi:Oligopeptidase A [Melipona quadrifasciata]|uniref:oligopeptidase A n=1 Tax=Melipona quadrifasciata TaxID=166423 RepID=A0A0N0U702_9HYME|nr:Oligopeptidase A [Melipona quadrifasciata]